MYYGLRLYSASYINMDFEKLDPASFKMGDELSRIVYEAALCIGVMDGISLEGVYVGKRLIGKCNLYRVDYIVNGVKVSFAFTIESLKSSESYDWLVNMGLSYHEKVTYFRNYISEVLSMFNKGIKPMIFTGEYEKWEAEDAESKAIH